MTDAGTTTFATAFAEALEELGVRHAFGVSGGAISFFWSALGGPGIQVTHFRHESGAAFAACEASVATGAPVVVFVTTGPGLTNVLTGVYAARHEPARVILVSACTDAGMYGRRPIQETGPRTLPHEGLFTAGPLFDIATMVTTAEELPALAGVLAEAVSTGQRFVAHISLTLRAQRGLTHRVHPAIRAAARPDVSKSAADAFELLHNRRWVLWVGAGTRRLAGPVRRLAEATGVAVMATPRGKGVIAEEHPRYLGVTGFGGHPSVLDHLRRERPEYTLVLGTALGDAASGYLPGYLPGIAFIHVDTDPSVPGAAYPDAMTVPVIADAGEFADQLAAHFEKRPATRSTAAAPDVHPFACSAPGRDGGRVHPAYLMEVVQEVFVEAGVLVMAETGNAMAWAINRLRFGDPRQWRTPSGMVGSMAHCSTGVVGAALVTSRKTVALVGDGTMLMLNEVSTAVATGAPAIWVVLNDSCYNMCAQGAEVLGLTDVDCRLPDTDFAGYARTLGACGISVARPDEVLGGLRTALARPGPVVVDVKVDPAIGAPTAGRNAGLLRDRVDHTAAP
ncbi:MAG TPA: thiamine pyrophosphate-binding protein [Actinoplanes sp.]